MSTLSTAQLADLVEKAKILLRIEDDDATYHKDALALYHDGTAGTATAATVQIESGVMTLIVTGGANAGTDTLTLSDVANDTLTELVAAINALATGWVATLLGRDTDDSTLLLRKPQTSVLLQANELTLVMENNDLLELLITNVFAGMETCLQRGILSTAYTGERYRWSSTGIITLQQPDITSIEFVGAELADGLTVTYTGSDTNARVQVTDTAVVTTSVSDATPTTTTSTFAANETTTAMATTIGLLAGWSATVVNAFPSALLRRMGTTKAKDREVTLECWEDSDASYMTEFEAGTLQFTEAPGWCMTGEMRIDYTAGFAELPADVEQALLDGVKLGWDTTQRTGGLKSEKLGDYSYTMADTASLVSGAQAAGASVAGGLTGYLRMLP